MATNPNQKQNASQDITCENAVELCLTSGNSDSVAKFLEGTITKHEQEKRVNFFTQLVSKIKNSVAAEQAKVTLNTVRKNLGPWYGPLVCSDMLASWKLRSSEKDFRVSVRDPFVHKLLGYIAEEPFYWTEVWKPDVLLCVSAVIFSKKKESRMQGNLYLREVPVFCKTRAKNGNDEDIITKYQKFLSDYLSEYGSTSLLEGPPTEVSAPKSPNRLSTAPEFLEEFTAGKCLEYLFSSHENRHGNSNKYKEIVVNTLGLSPSLVEYIYVEHLQETIRFPENLYDHEHYEKTTCDLFLTYLCTSPENQEARLVKASENAETERTRLLNSLRKLLARMCSYDAMEQQYFVQIQLAEARENQRDSEIKVDQALSDVEAHCAKIRESLNTLRVTLATQNIAKQLDQWVSNIAPLFENNLSYSVEIPQNGSPLTLLGNHNTWSVEHYAACLLDYLTCKINKNTEYYDENAQTFCDAWRAFIINKMQKFLSDEPIAVEHLKVLSAKGLISVDFTLPGRYISDFPALTHLHELAKKWHKEYQKHKNSGGFFGARKWPLSLVQWVLGTGIDTYDGDALIDFGTYFDSDNIGALIKATNLLRFGSENHIKKTVKTEVSFDGDKKFVKLIVKYASPETYKPLYETLQTLSREKFSQNQAKVSTIGSNDTSTAIINAISPREAFEAQFYEITSEECFALKSKSGEELMRVELVSEGECRSNVIRMTFNLGAPDNNNIIFDVTED